MQPGKQDTHTRGRWNNKATFAHLAGSGNAYDHRTKKEEVYCLMEDLNKK